MLQIGIYLTSTQFSLDTVKVVKFTTKKKGMTLAVRLG